MDEVIFEEFKGTGNSEIILDRKVADKRTFPSMDITRSGTRKEELLVPPDILKKMYVLRRILNPMGTVDAIEFLLGKLRETKTNANFFEFDEHLSSPPGLRRDLDPSKTRAKERVAPCPNRRSRPSPISEWRSTVSMRQMHELLIERGRVIDRLIEIKTRQGGGSAFRPAREASMMRAIAERHRGRLPLDTVESIWRVIISTFTYIQAPYSVHIDVSGDDAANARLCPVPFRLHRSMRAALRAPRTSSALSADRAAIWACLRSTAVRGPAPGGRGSRRRTRRRSSPGCRSWSAPIIPRACRCSSSRNHWSTGPRARWCSSRLRSTAGAPIFRRRCAGSARKSIGSAANGMGLALLVARPGAVAADAVSEALRSAGGADVRASEVGAHADRFDASALRNRAN